MNNKFQESKALRLKENMEAPHDHSETVSPPIITMKYFTILVNASVPVVKIGWKACAYIYQNNYLRMIEFKIIAAEIYSFRIKNTVQALKYPSAAAVTLYMPGLKAFF